MQTPASRNSDWFDRASDWCNPILVKEVRQSLKSRAFTTAFFLLLLGSWMISAIGLLAAGPAIQYGSVGQYFFTFYFGALCVALGVVVPFNAFRSLLTERDENTYELLSITALAPGQIVRGKWSCALVQALLFYSAIIPFIAFSSLLQGFNLAQSLLLLAVAMYGSIALSITTLMLSTIVRGRSWQGLMSMLVMAVLGGGIALTVSGLSSLMFVQLPIDRAEFWWILAILLLVSLSYMWLFYQIAAARLTFESENRATGIRLTAMAQLILFWLVAAAFAEFIAPRIDQEFLIVLIAATGIHLAIVGISVSAEIDGLSRRASRDLPKYALARAAIAPLLPGGALGYLYLLIGLAIYLAFCCYGTIWIHPGHVANPLPLTDILTAAFADDHSRWAGIERRNALLLALAIGCYIAIYCGLAACLLRWGRRLSRAFAPVHARTLTIILIATGLIVPMGLRVGQFIPFRETSVFDVLFAFWFFGEILARTSLPEQFLIVFSATLLVVALNALPILRALAACLAPPRPSSSRPHPEPANPQRSTLNPQP